MKKKVHEVCKCTFFSLFSTAVFKGGDYSRTALGELIEKTL